MFARLGRGLRKVLSTTRHRRAPPGGVVGYFETRCLESAVATGFVKKASISAESADDRSSVGLRRRQVTSLTVGVRRGCSGWQPPLPIFVSYSFGTSLTVVATRTQAGSRLPATVGLAGPGRLAEAHNSREPVVVRRTLRRTDRGL